MIAEDYVENGPTQVKTPPISSSLLRVDHSLVAWWNQLSVSSIRSQSETPACKDSCLQDKIKGEWIIPFGEEEWGNSVWMCLMKCRHSQYSHTRGMSRYWTREALDASHGCFKNKMHQSASGYSPCMFVHHCVCLRVCLGNYMNECIPYMHIHHAFTCYILCK